jgi:hypothetical protein
VSTPIARWAAASSARQALRRLRIERRQAQEHRGDHRLGQVAGIERLGHHLQAGLNLSAPLQRRIGLVEQRL